MDKRPRRASTCRIRLFLDRAPRVMKSPGRAVDVRLYPDACTTHGGLAAIAFFANPSDKFAVLLKGGAKAELLNSLRDTNAIFGVEMFAMVAAVMALRGQQRGKRMVLCLDNSAAAGALIKAPAVILALKGTGGELPGTHSAAACIMMGGTGVVGG